MLTLKFVPSAEWATRPFMGPQIVVIDEQQRLGFWSGVTYALPGQGLASAALKLHLRRMWHMRVAKLMAQHPPVVNPDPDALTDPLKVNTFVFVDPTVVGPGAGTIADPLKDPPTTVFTARTSILFMEGTTYTAAAGGGTATVFVVNADYVLFGTYGRGSTATNVRRVYDIGRIAKINCNQSRKCVASTNSNITGVVVSGLEIYNLEGVSQPEVIAMGPQLTGPSAGWVTEYVYIHDVVTTTGSPAGTGNGAGIKSRGDRPIIRFNRVRIADADCINTSNLAGGWGEHPEVYGNDCEVLTTTTMDGPDALHMTHSIGAISLRVQANWLNNSNVNVKQAFIVNDAAAAGTGLGGLVEGNVMLGCDVGADVYVSGAKAAGSNQRCAQIMMANVRFWNNVTIGGEYGLFVDPSGQCDARGNIHYMTASSGPQEHLQIGMNFSTGTASTCEFNTVVLMNPVAGSRGIVQSGSNVHVANANIVQGPWEIGIRKATNGTEADNIVFGAAIPVSNSSSVLTAPASSTLTGFNPMLDELLRPTVDVPLADGYAPFDVDVYGNPFRSVVGATH